MLLLPSARAALTRAGLAQAAASRTALSIASRSASTDASTTTSASSSTEAPTPAPDASQPERATRRRPAPSADLASAGGAAGKASAAASARAASSPRNPFLPYKNPNTGRWKPAMPLRRQAQLAKAAHRAGILDQLPDGPKVDALKTRIARNQEAAEREERMARFHAEGGGQAMWAKLLADVRARREREKEQAGAAPGDGSVLPLPSSLRDSPAGKLVEAVRQTAAESAAQLAREAFKRRGPYAGRNPTKMFKGHKAERELPQRLKNREERMAAMDETVREWRKSKAEAKKKLQPTLPF